MIDAVFISDLHLNPNQPMITDRFKKFLEWASTNTKKLYILGDFFHAWPGDDALDNWSQEIASCLQAVSSKVTTYLMHGNRDFLVGPAFAELAGVTLISDPTYFDIEYPVILAHGDQLCTKDKGHQWLRFFTRNRWFPAFFLRLPFQIRSLIVNRVRQYSQSNENKRNKSQIQTDVVVKSMINFLKKNAARVIIHGHTHRPGLKHFTWETITYSQYVLSDWDKNPSILCYTQGKGFKFIVFEGV